jgi:hypothetical protein
MSDTTVADVAAEAFGYRPPMKGLIGSGFEQIVAYQRASEVLKALGIDPSTPIDVLRSRLRIGERSEQAAKIGFSSTPNDPRGLYGKGWAECLCWLRAVDTKETP